MKRSQRIVLLFVLLVCGSLLSACSTFVENIGNFSERNEWRDKIYDLNQEGYDLVDQGKYEEGIKVLKEAVEYVYKLTPELKELDKEIKLSELADSPFNNLSWAYNELGDYEVSLEYIEKSLLILPNTAVEYANKGNALYGLKRYDEALESYNKANELEKDNTYAYYGRGMVYFDTGKYEEALKEFETYLDYSPNDLDAAEMKVYTLLWLEEDQQALDYANEVIRHHQGSYEAYDMKAAVLDYQDDFEATKKFYEEVAKQFPDRLEAQLKLGELYEQYGEYDQSVDYYKQLLETYPKEKDVYIRIMQNYSALGEMGLVQQTFDEALQLDTADLDLYVEMGRILMGETMYMEAVAFFEPVIEQDPLDEMAYIFKQKALYLGKRYLQCVEFGQETENLAVEYTDLAWYTANCHMELGNYDEAIQYFEQVIAMDPEDDQAFAEIAYAYLMMDQMDKAEEYSAKSLNVYSGDNLAQYVKNAVQEKKKPLGQRIKTFFRENYLYKDSLSNLDQVLSELDRPDLTAEEIAKIIERAKKPDDRFTYVIYGKDFDQMVGPQTDDITFKEEGNIVYFRIYDFERNTDDAFIKYLDQVENTEDKTLVLDVRSNAGGFTDSANNMLDALLPSYVTSTLIYEDGYTDHYYSNDSYVKFKHIYVFVDEYTASAAELLTLGLRTYANNVTVVGRTTFGKGVGQLVFEDRMNKLALYLVNHYWNVKQNNVTNTQIKPDIVIQGNQLDSFMKPVKEGRKK